MFSYLNIINTSTAQAILTTWYCPNTPCLCSTIIKNYPDIFAIAPLEKHLIWSTFQGWGAGVGALEPSIFSGAGAFLNISCGAGAGATKYLSAPILSIANFNNFLS